MSPSTMLRFMNQKHLQAVSKQYVRGVLFFSSSTSKQEKKTHMEVFDRQTKLLQKERAAAFSDHQVFDYLKDEFCKAANITLPRLLSHSKANKNALHRLSIEPGLCSVEHFKAFHDGKNGLKVGYRLADRILDIKKILKNGLDLGCGKGFASKHIDDTSLETLFMSEFSPGLLSMASEPENITVTKKVIDEEAKLPFETESLDIVISNLSLHWVNNLPGCLKEVHRVLRKDGVFLASMFGGDTLYELRSSFVLAELEREGGFSSHVSPFTAIQDIGGLLNNAGFSMQTIDTDEIVVCYPSMFELMWDLKGMGENNASLSRKLHLHRDTLMAAAAIYQEMYGKEDSIPATYQIIYMIGWKPDPQVEVAQAKRGSGTVSMKDLHRLNDLIKEHGMEGRVKFLHDLDKGPKGGTDRKGDS